MKKSLIKNWPAKIASLVAAFAIWYVIHQHIHDGVDFNFISKQARDQQMLQEELKRKQLEVSFLEERINQIKIDEAQKAIVVEEEEEKKADAPSTPEETPPP